MTREWREGATPDETARLDDIATTMTGPPLARMLARAGAGLAREVAVLAHGGRIAILAGPGVNGAGGLECAMVLHERRVDAAVVTAMDRPVEPTQERLELYRKMGCELGTIDDARKASLVVDALLGYRARGAPRGSVAQLLPELGESRVVSLDVATGWDPLTGEPHSPRLDPDLVVAVACVKTGTLRMVPRPRVVVIDVGFPPAAYAMAGIERPPFVDGRVELPR